MEAFKDSDVPILILTNNVDEICFQQNGEFKGYKFVSLESSYEEVSKILGDKHQQ